jgi:UDP-N-acetylglucosamine 2-epimerase
MSQLRITTVVGARPQFVKLAPLSPRLREVAHERILHTGQHYDHEMSKLFFEELAIPEPDRHLGVGSGSHGAQVGKTLVAVEEDLIAHRPDLVLVFGDTNSTVGAAIAAAKAGVPVAHVEAGVRGWNRAEPEETNRVLTDHLSELLFVPTEVAAENLSREGITTGVHPVGDVMVDTLRLARETHGDGVPRLQALALEPRTYALCTFHRPANVDHPAPLAAIVDALGALGMPAVWPVHPRTRERLQGFGLLDRLHAAGVRVVPPVGYLTMLALLLNARLALTDSGGLQKEAYLVEVPCVTVSAQTAWVETVDAGWNRLVPPSRRAIVDAATGFSRGESHPDCYGDGHASTRIAGAIADWAGR